MVDASWWCCIITRDGEETIGPTLDSIVGQSLPPDFVVVVNDGSRDSTPEIIKERSRAFPKLYAVNTNSKTRDIRRVPALLNVGLDFAEKRFEKMPGYMMINGDDDLLSKGYASTILQRMISEEDIAVASGSWRHSKRIEVMPTGAGRLVRMDYMRTIGDRYPVVYGWEPWLLYKALELGYKVRNYHDAKYKRQRPYNPQNLFGWGRAMYSLGFPSYFVFLRFLVNFFWASRGARSRRASVTMLVGYLQAKLNKNSVKSMLIEDAQLKAFVRHYATTRLVKLSNIF